MRGTIAYCLIFYALLFTTTRTWAQQNPDYAVQLAALKQSFDEGSPEHIKAHVSDELAFGQYPASLTTTILGQFFSGQLKLKEMEVLETEKGSVNIRYDIYGLGEQTSKLLFDEGGKITRIELIDHVIKLQQELQKQAASQVKAPTPDGLADQYPFQEVTFKSKDGLQVVGNLYEINKTAPVILLCHQAGYNKYEYADIAPRLNALGFNALAIDQRSGGDLAGHGNETFKKAQSMELGTEFLDAQQDIEAAVDFLHDRYGKKVIAWGSSYSSSLVLHVAMSNDKVQAVISFSPGDYFADERPSLATVFPRLNVPFLVTSSKRESTELGRLLEDVSLKANQQQFIPEGTGFHGSKALWVNQQGGEEYWQVVKAFLDKL